jgi:hypothetical protein
MPQAVIALAILHPGASGAISDCGGRSRHVSKVSSRILFLSEKNQRASVRIYRWRHRCYYFQHFRLWYLSEVVAREHEFRYRGESGLQIVNAAPNHGGERANTAAQSRKSSLLCDALDGEYPQLTVFVTDLSRFQISWRSIGSLSLFQIVENRHDDARCRRCA